MLACADALPGQSQTPKWKNDGYRAYTDDLCKAERSRTVIPEEGACAHKAKKIDREEKPEEKSAYVPKSLASEEGVEDLAVFHMHFSGKEDPVMRQCLCLSF